MTYSMFVLKKNRVKPIIKVLPLSEEKTSVDEEKNIFKSLKLFVLFFQILGILPQENIWKNINDMHFKWLSYRMAYTLTIITFLAVAVGCCCIHWVLHGSNIDGIATGVFYGGSLTTMILYLYLAISWKKLIKSWYSIDKIMNVTYGYTDTLDKNIKLFSVIFVALGITDHLLSVANRYESLNQLYGKNLTLKIYCNNTFPQLFTYVPYNLGTAIVCMIITIHSNLSWAFNDLFIIIISAALALRFQQISKKLNAEKYKSNTLSFWREIREDYDRLASFCKELDSHVSAIVLLSYFLNIFFLLIQLYHTLESVFLVVRKVYFTFSFGYLIFKTSFVSLYAAWINDESRTPTNILNSVESSSYNVEIITIHSNLSWAFNDLFIIIISAALALRFQQISKKLNAEKYKSNTLSFWREIREDYDRLASFCKELDSHVSAIVLLSYFLNIFFLLIQLYHTLESVFLVVRKVYFTFSFGYLIFKTSFVSLYAAWINDESRTPTNILNSVESSSYNVEIRRLLTQISFDKTALTGCKMFSVKRGTILSVASAIVTYELVLIQFSEANLYETH